ncbi:osm1 [Symbiodinium sp. KB8]|nr:osm1 [Symbiodinium sp. KB8]
MEGVWCAVPYKITVIAAEGTAEASEAQRIVDEVFGETEKTFSHFVEDSEVSQLNRLAKKTLFKPSPAMKKVLSAAGTINRMTRGAFDPAILPLAAHYKKTPGVEPSSDLISHSKWSAFEITEEGVTKQHDSAMMDLCGLAKGWAIDEMSQRLKDFGFTASYVDWGGDIKVSGQHPTGRNWTAAVLEPYPLNGSNEPEKADEGKEAEHIAHIELRDGQAIATSGDYLQQLADDKNQKTRCHVLDGRSDKKLVQISHHSVASASVVCSSCMIADALATSALAVGETSVRESRKLLEVFTGHALKDPVTDFLLFSRLGPRVVRWRPPGSEAQEHRELRHASHEEGAHVVIVGGGLAGVSAAVEAVKAKATVTLLEKEAQLGGNSAKATSGINACGTRVQKAYGVDDDVRWLERDTFVSAKGGSSDQGCVSMLASKSAEAIHWLIDELGIPLSELSQLGGHAKKRTHRCPPKADGTPVPVGYTIMQHARAAAMAIPGVSVKTNSTMKRLLQKTREDGALEVCGVEYMDADGELQTLSCDAVILTTGGFGFDHSDGSLMKQYRPDLVGVPTTNGSFANGDGMRFGADVGASLVDMDKVQLHPTALIDPKDPLCHTKYLGPEALRGSGGILLDQQGRRFVNELDLRSTVSAKILEHCEEYHIEGSAEKGRPWSWCVLNQECQQKFGLPMLGFYKSQGLFEEVTGTAGLAALLGCEEQTILETFKDYANACDQKICQKTGKTVFPSKVTEEDQSFVVARITPCIHYCMGGLEISPSGEVLTRKDGAMGKRSKIHRLFAAGECTGGVHGGNRLGGNSLLECVVFGRIAGEKAAAINQKEQGLLSSGTWLPVKLREIRDTDERYGHNTAVYRFELHGSMQTTGLEVGRYIGIKGEIDGDTVTGFYSPISRPEDSGVIDILCRTDEKGGPIVSLLNSMQPGSSCMMAGMGGVKLKQDVTTGGFSYQGRSIKKLSLLCGGTGLAPAVQVVRAYVNMISKFPEQMPISPDEGGVKIVYAAETHGDLAFITALDQLKERFPQLISYYLVLNKPPRGWVQGIGFVDGDIIRQRLWFPGSEDHVCVMCGPPIFEKIMCANLAKMGYDRGQYYSFADPTDC